MDAHRFLEAGCVLQIDRDQVAGLQHLGGGLSEARLVAIHHREGDQPRQDRQERDHGRRKRAAPASAEESVNPGFGHRP